MDKLSMLFVCLNICEENMAENTRIGSKPAPYMRTENNGMFSSPGPFIGIIKNNIDPTANGRLQIYIPQYGGPDENDPGNWLTVSYASPFRGQTRQRADLDWYIDSNIDATKTNGSIQENSFQSYGFWFVPPDLNGRVLCVFANGDPSQGYWIACIQDSMDSHMIPAIGAVPAAKSNNPGDGGYIWQPKDNPSNAPEIPTHTMLEQYIQISDGNNKEIPYRLPVSEPVITNQANSNPSTPLQVLMVPQVYQTLQLGLQGLAFDFIRGSTSASSVRENPSQVFGISTPGRLTSFANVTLSQNILSQLTSFINSGQTSSPELETALNCTYRTGGHQFVMDDGSITGQDQGIRIRTTGGNEILLDDTNGQIYIINGLGTAWVELSPSGFIDIFSAKDFSIRSQGSINLHGDKNININAGQNLQIHADGDVKIDSGGSLTERSTNGIIIYDKSNMKIGTGGELMVSSTQAGFNTGSQFNVQAASINLPGSARIVTDPDPLQQNKQIEVAKQSGTKTWWQTGTFKSITSRAPAHEPWPNHEINGIKTATVPQGNALGTAIVRPQSNTTSSGVRGTPLGQSVNETDIASQPLTGPLCGLTVTQTQAFLAALGKNESGWPKNQPGTGGTTTWQTSNGGKGYYAVNQLGFTGKYQFGGPALETYNFLKPGSSKHSTTANAINNSANWTGYMGCNSAVDFMNNGAAQEALIMLMMKANCKQLTRWGILTPNSTPEEVAGYLGVCQLVGAGGCLTYYRQQNPNSTLTNAPTTQYATSDANGSTSGRYFTLGSNAVQLANSSTAA
jgi:hypothetical protein